MKESAFSTAQDERSAPLSPVLTTGHDFLHSCRHFFGLHLCSGRYQSHAQCSTSGSYMSKHSAATRRDTLVAADDGDSC